MGPAAGPRLRPRLWIWSVATLAQRDNGMKFKILLVAIAAAGCSGEPEATRIADLDLAKLDGLPAKCAEAAARSAYDSLPTTAADAIEAELQQCVVDVYLMGVEDGVYLSERLLAGYRCGPKNKAGPGTPLRMADSVTCGVGVALAVSLAFSSPATPEACPSDAGNRAAEDTRICESSNE